MSEERPSTLAETLPLRGTSGISKWSVLRTRSKTTVLVAIDGRSTMPTDGSRDPLSATSTTCDTPAKLLGRVFLSEYITAKPAAMTQKTTSERRLRIVKKRGIVIGDNS